jgi:lipopolysaccharide export system protein LptC
MSGAARGASAFARARRHSRLVRALRVAMISGAVGGVATLTGLGLYHTFGRALGGLSIGDVSIDGTKISMDRPRLTGARSDGGGYVINARKAIQDIKNPSQVQLVAIDGDITPANHDTLHLTAAAGHYDSGGERLDLSGAARMKNSSYAIDLSSAHIDFKTGVYSSRDPVAVVTANGASITADSALVRDNGGTITFEGHVRSVFQPSAAAGEGMPIKGTEP